MCYWYYHYMLLVVSSSISISNCQNIFHRKIAFHIPIFWMERLRVRNVSWIQISQKVICSMQDQWLWVQNTVSPRLHTKYTLTHLKVQGISLHSKERQDFMQWLSLNDTFYSQNPILQSLVVMKETFSRSNPINFLSVLFKLGKDN